MDRNNIKGKLTDAFGQNRIKENEVISAKIVSRIGGVVKYYLEVQKQDELIQALSILRDSNEKFIIIGTGSNTIFADEGFDGVVIKNNCRKFEILSMKGKIKNNKIDVDKGYLYAESGCILNQAVRYSLENGFGGLEDLLGTPGSVGGFIKRSLTSEDNNSAVKTLYQLRLIDKLGQLKFIDPTKNPIKDFSKVLDNDDFILSATFLLTPGDENRLWSKATKNATDKEKEYSLGMPIGFIFKDITLATAMSTPTPGYATSAKELVEKSDAITITTRGVGLSKINGNLLLNLGDATTNDILNLVKEIRQRVFKKFGVKLEMQLKIIK